MLSLRKPFFILFVVPAALTIFLASSALTEVFQPDILFYDVKTHQRFSMRLASRIESLKSKVHQMFVGRANGCDCQQLVCGCCAGLMFEQFNFDQEGCMNFTYNPLEFSLGVNMLFNENSIYMNSISDFQKYFLKATSETKNPPPICVPIPLTVPFVPIPAPNVEMCMKLFDVFMPGQNLHMCMDMEIRFERAKLFVLHFDCMQMGNDGFSLLKPNETVGQSQAPNQQEESPQSESDTYDPVTEIKL